MQTPLPPQSQSWDVDLEYNGVKKTVTVDRDPSLLTNKDFDAMSDTVFGTDFAKRYPTTAQETKVGRVAGVAGDEMEPAITTLLKNRRAIAGKLGSEMTGTPYKWGGNEPGKGIDCSGFTCKVYKNEFGIELPRTADAQAKTKTLQNVPMDQLQPGDLLFFKGTNPKKPEGSYTHTGIYIGNGKMRHAGSSNGVTEVDLARYPIKPALARRPAAVAETPKQRNIRLENERLRPKTEVEESRVGATTNRNMADFFKEAVQGLPVEPSIGKTMVPPKTAPVPPLDPSFLKQKPKQMPGMLGETTESLPNVERGTDVTQIGRIVPIGGQEQIGDIWRKMGMEPPAAPEDPAVKWRRETEAWNQWREGFGRDIASALKKGAGIATLPFGPASQVITNGISDLAGMLAGGIVTYPVDLGYELEGLLTPGRTDEEYAKGGANVALGLLSLVPGAALAKFGTAGKIAEAVVDPVSVLLRKVIAPGYKAGGKLWATVADNLQKRYGVVTEGGDQAVRRAMGESAFPMEGTPAPEPLQTIKTQKGSLVPEELSDSQIADNIFRIQNLKKPTAKHKADLEALQGELNRRRAGASGTPGPKPIAEVSQGGSTPPASTPDGPVETSSVVKEPWEVHLFPEGHVLRGNTPFRFDPDVYEPNPLYNGDYSGSEKPWRLRKGLGYSEWNSFLKGRDGHIYRGIGPREADAIAQRGAIESDRSMNFDVQQDTTSWSKDLEQARSYASSFAVSHEQPTFGRPGYIVETRMPTPSAIKRTHGKELDVLGATNVDDVTRVWEVRAGQMNADGPSHFVTRELSPSEIGEWKRGRRDFSDAPVEAPTSPAEAPLPVRPTSDTPQEVQPVSVSPARSVSGDLANRAMNIREAGATWQRDGDTISVRFDASVKADDIADRIPDDALNPNSFRGAAELSMRGFYRDAGGREASAAISNAVNSGTIMADVDELRFVDGSPIIGVTKRGGEPFRIKFRSDADAIAFERQLADAPVSVSPVEVTPSAVQESSATPKIVGDQSQSSGGVREGLPQEPAGTGAQEAPQAQEVPVGGKRNVFLGGNAGKRATVTFADERQEASVVLGSKLRNRLKGTGKAGQGKTGPGKTPQEIEAEIAGARDAMREHFPGLSDSELDTLARKADADVRGQTKGLKDGAEVVLKQTAEIEEISGKRKVQRGGVTYELDGPAAKAWADADNEYRRAMKEAIDRDDAGMKKVASEQRTATRNAILDSGEGVTETGKTFERAVADARSIEDPVAQFEALIEAGKIPHSGGGVGKNRRRGAISLPDATRLVWAYAVMKARLRIGVRNLNELMEGLMQGLGENAHAIADRLPRLARRAMSDHEAGTVTSDETLLKLVEYEERGAHDDIRDNLLYIHNNDTELVDSLLSETGEKAKAQMESGNRAYLGGDDKARTNTIGKLVGKANDGKPWSHEEQSFIVTAMADYKDRVKSIKGAVDAAIDANDQTKARELGAGLDDLEGMYDDMAMALYRARSEMGRALGNPPTLRSVDDPIYVRFEIERRLGRRLNPADPYDANTISNTNELAGNLQKLGVNEDDVARAASIESAKMLIVGRERRKLTLEQLAKKKENAAKNYDRELRRVIREATEKISLNPVTDPVAVVKVVKSAAEMVFWKRLYQLSDPVQPIDFAKTVQAELQRVLAANPTAFSPAERQLILGASDTDILDVFSGFRGFQTPKTKTIQEMELTEMRGLSRLFRSLQLIKSGIMPPSSPKLQQISRDLELIRKRKHEIKSEINALIMAQTPTTLSQTGAIIGRGLRLTDAVQRIADGLGTAVNQGTRLHSGNLQYLVDKTLNPKADAVVPFSLPLEGMWSMLSDPIGNATEYGKVMRRVYMGQDIGAKFGRGVSNYAANFQPGTPSHTLASILDVGAKGMSAFPAIADAATEPILARGVYAKRLAWSRGKKIAQANGVSRADAARMVMLSDRDAILDVANIVKEGLLFSRDNWLSQFFTNITKKIEKAPLPQGSVARAATVAGRLITRMTIDFAAAFPRFFWNFAVANAQYAGAGVPYGVVKHLAHPRGVERSPASRIAVAESIERGLTGMILGYGIGGELLMNTLIANGLANPEIDPYGDTSLGLTFRYGKAVEGVMRQMPGIMMPLRMGMDRAIARRMLAQREAQLLNGETPTVTDEQARQLVTMVNAEGTPLGAVKMAANDVIRGFTEMPLFTGVEHAAKLASGREEETNVAADTAVKTLFVYWPGFARGWARNQDLEKDIRRFPGWEAAMDTDDAISGVVRTVQRIRDEALVRIPFANESVKAKVNGYTVPFGEEAAMYLKAYGKSFSVGEVPEGIVNQSMRDLYTKIVNVKVAGWLDEYFTEKYQREGKAGVDRIKSMTKDQKTEDWEELTKVKTIDPRTMKPKTVDGDLAYAIKDARDYAESVVTKLQEKR